MTSASLINLGLGALVAIVGWLITRAIHGMDMKVASLGAGLGNLDTKLDTLAGKNAEQDISLAEVRVRVTHLEMEVSSWRTTQRDLVGFLQSKGFQKRDGQE